MRKTEGKQKKSTKRKKRKRTRMHTVYTPLVKTFQWRTECLTSPKQIEVEAFQPATLNRFDRMAQTLLPIRFRTKHARRNIPARNVLQMVRPRMFATATSKHTNSRRRKEKRIGKMNEGDGARRERGAGDRTGLLTIFSCINSLSITIQRACPSVNATIIRW